MLPTVSQVAATLHFNPSLEYLAERVVAYITRDGRRRFNGAQRRAEHRPSLPGHTSTVRCTPLPSPN